MNKILILCISLLLFACATAPVTRIPLKNNTNSYCYPKTSKEFLRWNKSNGKELAGLTKRREEEYELFLKC